MLENGSSDSSLPLSLSGRGGEGDAGVREAVDGGEVEDVGEPGGVGGRRGGHHVTGSHVEEMAGGEPGYHAEEAELQAVQLGLNRKRARQKIDCGSRCFLV